MQRLREGIRPYLGSAQFNRSALAVMLPVTVQQLINNLFNMIDNLMVGSLDVQGIAMSAVSVANKPVVIFNGLIFGMVGAGGLLVSQYFGARDRKTCAGIFWLEMMLTVCTSLLFFALLFFWPEQVMRVFVTDGRTVAQGVTYLHIISFSYIPAAVSGVCIFSLRAIGQNRVSMLVSLGSMAVNATCNYVLIFGKLGFAAMGVAGAAYGTLIARLFEMSFYLTLMLRRRMYFPFEPNAFIGLSAKVRRAFRGKAVPLVINELLYSFGLNIFFWCYARMDESALPALAIAELAYQISAVIVMGNSSAVSVLIGTELGAGELKKAKANCKKLFTLTFCISMVGMVLCGSMAFLLPLAYRVSEQLRTLATQVTLVFSVFAPINYLYAFCFFCLRAGGDTRNASLLDSGYMWAAPVPVCLVLALRFPGQLPLLTTVLIVQALMASKIFIALHVLRKGRWVRNITLCDCE